MVRGVSRPGARCPWEVLSGSSVSVDVAYTISRSDVKKQSVRLWRGNGLLDKVVDRSEEFVQ